MAADPSAGRLFLRRWLAHPLAVGSVTPSSRAVARAMLRQARLLPDHALVEVGAGTGPITRVLAEESGVPLDRLFAVELDPDLARFLRQNLPQVNVIEGDCTKLAGLLPPQWVGKVASVISAIPMVPLPVEVKRAMVDAFFAVMAPGGRLVQITYSWFSPLPADRLGLVARRRAFTLANLPPAWIWTFEKPG